MEITRKWGQMSKKPKKFEVRKSKYVTNLWMWSLWCWFSEGYLSSDTSIDACFLRCFPSLVKGREFDLFKLWVISIHYSQPYIFNLHNYGMCQGCRELLEGLFLSRLCQFALLVVRSRHFCLFKIMEWSNQQILEFIDASGDRKLYGIHPTLTSAWNSVLNESLVSQWVTECDVI